MAYRFLIYSTGTTYADTIVRESATDNPNANEASLNSNFVIPEIQPLYLWRVTGGTDVVPNIDSNINAYLDAIAPPPEPEDDASVGFVTGITATKIDKVTGATGYLGEFDVDGNLIDTGYQVSDLTGGTQYNFTGSGATQVTTGSTTGVVEIIIYSTPPTGSTVAWGDITGTLSAQTDLQSALNLKLDISDFNSYTGTTQTALNNKLETSVFNSYTGTSQPILDAALTGVTNLGTGTTLGLVSGRNITLKSVSVLGGLTLSGDVDNLIISGSTGGAGTITGGTNGLTTNGQNIELGGTLTKAGTGIDGDGFDFSMFNLDSLFISSSGTTYTDVGNWGGIRYSGDYSADYVARSLVDAAYVTGLTSDLQGDITYLSGQTDLKLDITDFNTFTGTTLPANYYNKTEINSYTGATDTRIDAIETVTDIALTGATNGLTAGSRVVELGGALTKDTKIGIGTFALSANTASIHFQAVNGIDIIDTDGVGGINIESDAGTVAIIGNTNVGVEQTKLEISETVMQITDSRTTKVGMVYATDYSATFTDESLITKRYADAIAAGFRVKDAVLVATTGNSTLSGLTTIDGVVLQEGDRVLVKNNTDGSENGIYSASTGTWGRTADYDGNPSGEVASGDLIPVMSGDTQYSTLWALVTQDPITVGTTALDYTLFSSPHEMQAGVGIDISGNVISVDGASLAGNSISWTGDTFNVDVNTGTLAASLALKLDVSVFDTFTGTTLPATYLAISDFNTFTGTTLPANYYNKTEINSYTGATDTRLDTIEDNITGLSATTATKLDTVIFTGYTASTKSNEIFLIHTGGTNLNTILATAIEWDSAEISGSSFNWTGSSEIQVLEKADYELNYNIPYNITANSSIGIGANIILNNNTVIDVTAAAGLATRNKGAGSVGLPTVILSLEANDVLNLATFRTHQSGTATSSLTGSILIKKKNTLQ